MKPARMVLMVLGVLLIAMGGLWFLQGIGVVAGSVMTGVTLWAIIGPVVAVAGVLLVVLARRRSAD